MYYPWKKNDLFTMNTFQSIAKKILIKQEFL